MGLELSTADAGAADVRSRSDQLSSLDARRPAHRFFIRQIEPLIQTSLPDLSGEISPDGHWLARYSNESGPAEVYVRPIPKVDDGRWLISTGAGSRPGWSKDGRELFYFRRRAQ
jgi:hypothetical protein